MEDGRWFLSGSWLDRDGPSTTVEGKLLVVWNRDNWYTLVTKLSFPNAPRRAISFQYRGRFVSDNRRYTFVLQHSAAITAAIPLCFSIATSVGLKGRVGLPRSPLFSATGS